MANDKWDVILPINKKRAENIADELALGRDSEVLYILARAFQMWSAPEPAAPDSREELKRKIEKIDAITCGFCRQGMRLLSDAEMELKDVNFTRGHRYHCHEYTGQLPFPCTAKGAEILALLPALKAEGERDAALEEAAVIAEIEGKVSYRDGGSISRTDACQNVAQAIRALKSGPKSESVAPPVAAQVDEAEVRFWHQEWLNDMTSEELSGDSGEREVAMLLAFAARSQQSGTQRK